MKTITTFLKNFLELQSKANVAIGKDIVPKLSCYDAELSPNKKYYKISYVHNRDVIPGGAIRTAKRIRKTII
jgi:hypothetical protein